MICVEQSRLGPDFGNCFEAAISSLLECPIDDVPRWQGVPDAPWEEYEPLLNAWLAERGLIVWVVSVIPEPLPLSVVGESLPPVPFVAGVRTTASYNHALVCDRSRVLWDPSPHRARPEIGLLGGRDPHVDCAFVLLPLDVSRPLPGEALSAHKGTGR